MRYFETGQKLFSFMRGVRAFPYLFLILGAVASMYSASPVISGVSSTFVTDIWASSLFLGGSLCFLSVIINNWILEYVGLPLVSSSFFVYGICAFLTADNSPDVFLTSGFFGLAVALYTLYRFGELYTSLKHNHRLDIFHPHKTN